LAEKTNGFTPLSFGREGFNFYKEVSTLSMIQKTTAQTISTAVAAFNNIGEAISDMGVNTLNQPVTNYPTLIRSIDTGSAEIAELEGYMADIYDAIGDKGGTCTEGDYSTYDDGVRSISTSGGGSSEEVTELEGYLADIYAAIIQQGGTCTENSYSTYDDGVLSIPTSSSEADLRARIAELEGQVSTLQSTVQTQAATISSLQAEVTSKTATISTLQGTITTYQSYFSDIASAITTKGGVVSDSTAYADYDTYVASIPSGGSSAREQELEGYLNDVYTVLAANTVGVTINQSPANYDSYISSIYSAYDSTISTKDSTIAARNATITGYESDFADIAAAITAKGGTVTSASAYSDFDTYVASIPNTVVQGGKLDSIKSQIAGINAKTQNAKSINSNFGDVPLIRVTDGSELFANMPSFDNVDMYLDMSACTDCTDMFKNSPKVPVITILNFGNNSNADLVLDLAVRDDFDLSYMAGDIKKYTTSPDGTKHVRKFLVTQGAYDLNNDWGAIETLRNKGITVEAKSGT
jgi:hypothetical protein